MTGGDGLGDGLGVGTAVATAVSHLDQARRYMMEAVAVLQAEGLDDIARVWIRAMTPLDHVLEVVETALANSEDS